MVSMNALKAELERQGNRFAGTTDPVNREILRSSIADLMTMLDLYPTGLVWAKDSRPKLGPAV